MKWTNEEMQTKMNKIHCMDCLEFMKKVPDDYFQLLIIDPPYHEIKGDFDFIWSSFDEYLVWIDELAKEFKRILSDNGSLYIYGHAKKIAYKQIIFDKYFNLENNLVWYKPDSKTKKGIREYRSFAPSTERILFYSNEVEKTGLETIKEIMPNPFSKILINEAVPHFGTVAKFRKFVTQVLNLDSAMVNRWLDNDCIIQEKYFDSIKKSGVKFSQEYEELRRPFNNVSFEDVLFFSQEAHNYKQYKHPTQKPPKLSRELISITTKRDSKVYIPFVGSGTEAEACKSLNLEWCGTELEPDYVEIANKRLSKVQTSIFGLEGVC